MTRVQDAVVAIFAISDVYAADKNKWSTAERSMHRSDVRAALNATFPAFTQSDLAEMAHAISSPHPHLGEDNVHSFRAPAWGVFATSFKGNYAHADSESDA